MDLRHLRYIVASARNGSFSAAAHEFNVRQPIVSKRIKEVEDELEVKLFVRSTAGARLTLAGEAFVVEARRIIGDFDRLAERARASGAGKLGRIVVGLYISLSQGALRTFIDDFRERYPDIDLELLEVPFAEMIAGLHSGRIDAALILGDPGKCEVLDSFALWSEHLVVALPQGHPLADKPVVYWPELKGERFLISHNDPGPDIRNILLRHLAAPSDHPEIVTLRLNRDNILSEVGSGEGISLQCESASGLTGLGVVFRPLHDGNGATRLGFIVYWKPDNINPVLQTLRNAFKEAMLIRP
ncbi:MAG: LysR family transcriptional regulator [Nitrobacter sp.]|uniref:LysR substrate-binding domain-containing protein n=1 Tax=Nitrobacter sp. TaxID=29420 RepID=UPI002621AA60|nr:LysR family transcriptional regulator [Nitrobacter sp.]MCV0387737.1 LysR family transcriptional regulator [Nitrobacter sp.]